MQTVFSVVVCHSSGPRASRTRLMRSLLGEQRSSQWTMWMHMTHIASIADWCPDGGIKVANKQTKWTMWTTGQLV